MSLTLADLKQKIVDEVPITAVVGDYLSLTRRGTSTLAVCPFHDDHSPSMNISDERKRYKCFACGAGGNAIDFVINYKNMDFMDAMKEISEKHGINFDDYVQKKNKSPKVEMAEKILEKTTLVYRKLAETGHFAPFNDFITNRGLNKKVADTFKLGFAPNNSSVTDYLNSIKSETDRKFALETAVEIGLIRVSDPSKAPAGAKDRSHYDTFRDRIIFPIWDHYGHVVGFQSRAIHDYQKAKYMHSKESFVFKKPNILYGLHLAKKAIRAKEAVILVEGNMDMISLYAKGFENCVAVMGTAMGDASLNALKGMTKNFYFALDNDAAGFKAATRFNEQCMRVDVLPKFIDISPEKDPDDFVQNVGSLAFQKRIDEAKPFIDILLQRTLPDRIPEILDQKLKVLEEGFEIVAPLGSSLMATERLIKFAKALGLTSDSAQIISSYKEFLEGVKLPEPQKTEEIQELVSEIETAPEYNEMTVFESGELHPVEVTLLKGLVQHPECLERDEIGELLDFVTTDEVKEYILSLKEIIYEIDESEYKSVVSKITSSGQYSKELSQAVNEALIKHQPSILNEKIIDKLLNDLKLKLQVDSLKTRRALIKDQTSNCTTEEELNDLMRQLMKIDKELSGLRSQKNI
ncbi:MAG: DNA primase [Deltaproteobacteria bacterium]|nr:MAG: DNA primase [Deltaproteobacteria bacterium]TNF27239.1 MAG: DNA primase [Deltaproteobacteria bacterium]